MEENAETGNIFPVEIEKLLLTAEEERREEERREEREKEEGLRSLFGTWTATKRTRASGTKATMDGNDENFTLNLSSVISNVFNAQKTPGEGRR